MILGTHQICMHQSFDKDDLDKWSGRTKAGTVMLDSDVFAAQNGFPRSR